MFLDGEVRTSILHEGSHYPPHDSQGGGMAQAQTQTTDHGVGGTGPVPPVTQDTETPRNRWQAELQSLRLTVATAELASSLMMEVLTSPCPSDGHHVTRGEGPTLLTGLACFLMLQLPQ